MYKFEYKGLITQSQYGDDFVPEFLLLIRKHAPEPIQGILEWGSGISSLALLDLAIDKDAELFVTIDTSSGLSRGRIPRERTTSRLPSY